MKRIVIIGAGSHAQVVADIILCMRDRDRTVEPVGFLDDNPDFANRSLLGIPILGPTSILSGLAYDEAVLGIGDNAVRAAFFEKLKARGTQFFSPIHPSAIMSPTAQIGSGSVICAGAILGVLTRVGHNVIMNSRSVIEHHSTVAGHAHIGGAAVVGGNITIGPGAFIGMGATIVSGCRIGAWSFIGADTLVFRDVPDRAKVLAVNKQFKRYPADIPS